MSRSAKVLTLAMILVGMSGCATPNMKLSEPGNEMEKVPQDKALIMFLRPARMGFKISAAVYDGDEFIGFVPYQQKLAYLAEPGEHLFMVVSEAADFMSATLQAGKKYYATVVPRKRAWRARFSLLPVTQSALAEPEMRQHIQEARFIKNKDLAYQWAERNHDSVLHKKSAVYESWMKKDAADRQHLAAEDGR